MFKESKFQHQTQSTCKPFAPDTLALIRQVQSFVSQNKRIFSEIQRLDASFTYKLYQPIAHQGIDQMFIKPLILRQIDQLIEENQTLCTRKEVLNLLQNEQKKKKENEIKNSTNHFSFLRSTWTKLRLQGLNSSQKIDGLNKIVGILKNNIKYIAQNEEKSVEREMIDESLNQSYLTNKINQRDRSEIQRLKMRNEQLQMQCVHYTEKLQQKDKVIEQLEQKFVKMDMEIRKLSKTDCNKDIKIEIPNKNVQQAGIQLRDHFQCEEENKYLEFSADNRDFRVKIQTSTITEIMFQETYRKLDQLLQFLRSRPSSINLCQSPIQLSPELQLPSLNLNINLNQTQSTAVTTLSASDRHFPSSLSKISKFIPMRTQRSHRLRGGDQLHFESELSIKTGAKEREIQNEEVKDIEDHKQNTKKQSNLLCVPSIVNPIQALNNSINSFDLNVSNILIPEMGAKRFTRKADLPLTSDRFRKGKIDEFNIVEPRA